jgi:PAS domain S-box-containing protein
MNHPLRVLIVEDSEMDVEFLLRTLRKGGYNVTYEVVETADAMRENLQNQTWDLITSDHSMPRFNAPGALALAKEHCPEIPFIIVSGEIDLNLAVSLMRSGAKDYIQKHDIARLPPAVERELLDAEQRRERRRAEAALQESTIRLKEIIENSADALYKRIISTGQYEYLSPAAAQLTGYSIDELKKQMPLSFQNLIHPDDVQLVERCYWESLVPRSNKNFQVDYRFMRKEGGVIWLQDRFTVLRDEEGNPLSYIGTVRDITERKQMEESLISSHRQIQRILRNVQDAYFQIDLEGKITMVNPAAVTIYGYPSTEAMLGMPGAGLYAHPQDREKMLVELHTTGAIRDWICQAKRQDGTVFWVSANIRFVREEDGMIIGTEGEIRDITERMQNEETPPHSE